MSLQGNGGSSINISSLYYWQLHLIFYRFLQYQWRLKEYSVCILLLFSRLILIAQSFLLLTDGITLNKILLKQVSVIIHDESVA